MANIKSYIGRQYLGTGSVWMQPVVAKIGGAVPEQVKVVYEVEVMDGAESFDPGVITKDSTILHITTVERGNRT